MTASQYYSFLTGGLAVLCTVGLSIAWLLWREREARQAAVKSALSGIAPEFRINLGRMIREVSALANGRTHSAGAILPIAHPQLDGVNANLVQTDRRALAAMSAAYQSLTSAKMELKDAILRQTDEADALSEAVDAVIDGIAALYLWEEHKGASPSEAESTRSWHVRDWMKAHKFQVDAFPGLHLRDAVVERLRLWGMTLTPKPLTHTAYEYYAMQYDRKADPRAPFWKRRAAKPAEAEPAVDVSPAVMTETAHEPAAELVQADTAPLESDPVQQT